MKQIAPGLFQIALLPRNGLNAYLIDGVLIDAGIRGSGPALLESIDSHGRNRIKAHALTHAHSDHQGASAFICQTLNVPLWCGEGDVEIMESGNVTSEFPNPHHPIVRFQQRYWAGPGYPVARHLREGDQVGDFQVIEIPGHSRGHVAFWRERDGVLIVGDALTNMNLLTTIVGLRQPPDFFTRDPAQNRLSIKKLAKLEPKLICFGHGPPLHNTGQLAELTKRF